MVEIPIWQVDAFADRPFSGNSAAVCVIEQNVPEAWMQAVAAEMNLSETAFIQRQDGGYGLRWFTPQVEVDLCGHATLASAHVLWSEAIHARTEPIRFFTRSGVLTCKREGEWIEMDFPATRFEPVDPPPGLLESLGLTATYIAKSQFDYLVVVDDPQMVRSAKPDFRELSRIATRGVMITSRSDDDRYDFISRFFGPGVGIDEDPVTGSAHCCLGPYWAKVLGKTKLNAFQASSRGGEVRVEVVGDRVRLGGQAVTVLRGSLFAEPK